MNAPIFPNDFSGTEKQNPLQKEKSDKERQREWNGELKKKGPYRIINTNHFTWIILLLAIGVFGFGYFTLNDYYKPVFVDNSSCTNTCPEIPECPSCTNTCPAPIINLNVSTPTINVNCNSTE